VRAGAEPARPLQEVSKRRGLGWVWLLPLLLLLLLGGCFLLRGRAVGGKGAAGLTLISPVSAAKLKAGSPLTCAGTGRVGETVTISENGTPVPTTRVNNPGRYSASFPAPAEGPHTYTVSETGTYMTPGRTVTLVGAGAATPPTTPSLTSVPSDVPAATVLTITALARDTAVPALERSRSKAPDHPVPS